MVEEESIFHLLRRAAQAAEAELESRLADLNLTARQLTILSLVAKSPKVSQTGLVEASGIDRSTMADIVRRMVQRGLIQRVRNERDTRAYELTITADGRTLLRKAGPLAERAAAEIEARLPDGGHIPLRRLLLALTRS